MGMVTSIHGAEGSILIVKTGAPGTEPTKYVMSGPDGSGVRQIRRNNDSMFFGKILGVAHRVFEGTLFPGSIIIGGFRYNVDDENISVGQSMTIEIIGEDKTLETRPVISIEVI